MVLFPRTAAPHRMVCVISPSIAVVRPNAGRSEPFQKGSVFLFRSITAYGYYGYTVDRFPPGASYSFAVLARVAGGAAARVIGGGGVTPFLAQEMSFGLFMFAMNAPLVAGLGILLWWMFGSRAASPERWLGPLAVVAIAIACYLLLDPSIKGMGFLFYVVPTGMAALTLALICLSRLRPDVRLWGALAAAAIGFVGWDLARSEGIWGDFKTTLAWRWKPTAEQLFLASLDKKDASGSKAPADTNSNDETANAAWPEFRGQQRDSAVPGVVLDTDWEKHPPKELWRRKVGPAWSSFP